MFIEFIWKIVNWICGRIKRSKKAEDNLTKALKADACEEFLFFLLELMEISFLTNRDFRKNLDGFSASIGFRDRSGEITVTAIFNKNKLHVKKILVDKPTVTLTFRDQKALLRFVTNPHMDILGPMLKQDISFDGNLNYLYKFAYMATHLIKPLIDKLEEKVA